MNYQQLFKKAQAETLQFRAKLMQTLATIRLIGRLSEDPRIVDLCKATIAGEPVPDDTARIDALEAFINQHGALVLHDGYADCGKHSGLGLRPGALNRTLREAIDAMGADRG